MITVSLVQAPKPSPAAEAPANPAPAPAAAVADPPQDIPVPALPKPEDPAPSPAAANPLHTGVTAEFADMRLSSPPAAAAAVSPAPAPAAPAAVSPGPEDGKAAGAKGFVAKRPCEGMSLLELAVKRQMLEKQSLGIIGVVSRIPSPKFVQPLHFEDLPGQVSR